MRPVVVQSSADFYFAKARALGNVQFRTANTSDLDIGLKAAMRQQHAAQYGRALQAMEASKYDEAQNVAAAVRGTEQCGILTSPPMTGARKEPATR